MEETEKRNVTNLFRLNYQVFKKYNISETSPQKITFRPGFPCRKTHGIKSRQVSTLIFLQGSCHYYYLDNELSIILFEKTHENVLKT
jgi:hypothetical protein